MKRKAFAVAIIVTLSLMMGSCDTKSAITEAPQTSVSEQPEEKLHTEGEDTECEVAFSPYSGEHSSMFLTKGDKIAVISPSALPSREQADSVIKGLKEWGYEPIEGKYVCVETRTLDDIMEDLEWALRDPDIKAIFCVRGGYGASEVADKLSGDLIKTSGKLIIGYSDITVYHSAWTANGVPSIHSCMSGTFGDFPESCFKAEENILKGELPVYTCKSDSYCKQGSAKGILIGGNLSTFSSTIGAAYDCTKTGQPYILFLEDESENMQHVHRYLTILKHAGVLDNAAGLIFGEWVDIPESMGDYDGNSRGGEFKSVADMISRQFLSDLDIPVAFGVPAGHGDINYPLLMGETAELNVDPESFRLSWDDPAITATGLDSYGSQEPVTDIKEADTARFEELYYARKIENILEHHTSSLSEITVYYQDEKIGSEYWYATPELHCWLSGDDDGFLNTMTQSVWAEEIYPGGYATFITNSDEKYKEWFEGDYDDYSTSPLGSEKLYAYEEKDGQFIAYTELSDEEAVSDMIEGHHAAYGGYTYTQGMKLRFRYVFDLAASDWLSADTSIVDADGTEHKFLNNSYTYDKDFDYKRDGSPLHDYFNSDGNSLCITITFCPGTSDEVTREYTIPQSTGVAIYKDNEKISELYSDPECTQLYAGGDGVSDLHLYVK